MSNFFSNIRRAFSLGVFLTSLGVGVALLLSDYGVFIRPHTTSFFSYLGMSFPFWALLNICFVVYWVIKRDLKGLFSLAALLLTLQSTWNYFPLNVDTHHTLPEPTYKFLSYNVQHLGFLKRDEPDDPNEIIHYIANQDADIVCMQEYAKSSNKRFLDSIQIHKVLHKYPYYEGTLSRTTVKREGGLAVFSKYPISNAREIIYESRNNCSMICDVHLPEGVVTVINNHLESNHFTAEDRKRFFDFTTDISKEKVSEMMRQLMPKLGVAFKMRAFQADVVRATIDSVSDRPIIVCGDFNDTPGSYVYKTIRGNLNDAFVANGKGLGITYNQNRFYFRIDHIFYNDQLDFYRTHIDHIRYSDHYPVIGVFGFK